MKSLTPLLLTSIITTSLAIPAFADEEANKKIQVENRLYVGGGLNMNVIDSPFGGSDDASGVTLFAGYKFDNNIHQDLTTSLEFGYGNTSDFGNDKDITSLYLAAVGDKKLPEIDPKLSVIGKIGLDVGDDDGILLGAGVGYQVAPAVQVRLEFINKDASSQYQASALFNF